MLCKLVILCTSGLPHTQDNLWYFEVFEHLRAL